MTYQKDMEGEVRQRLVAAGLGSPHPRDDELMRLESGHVYWTGHWPDGGWRMEAHHPGDPTGNSIVSYLGEDHARVPDRVADQFRRPAMVKALGEQWQRAMAAGDPSGSQGLHYKSKWQGIDHVFSDYDREDGHG